MNQHLTAHAWDADDNKPVIPKIPNPRPAPKHAFTELDTAIRVAQRMLCHYGTVDGSSTYAYTVAHGGLTEALRLLLRALGAEAVDAR